MKIKYVEGGAYFFGGGLIILILDYLSRVADYKYGHGHIPEVGLGY